MVFFNYDSFSQTHILIHFDNISVQLILTSYTKYEESIPYPQKTVKHIRNINKSLHQLKNTANTAVRQAQNVNLITRVSVPSCSGL